MAENELDIFSKTEKGAGGDLEDLDRGIIRSTGVGLREGEIAALAAIGKRLGDMMDTEAVARNALIRLSVRKLIVALRTGKLSWDDLLDHFIPPDKPKPRLDL